MASVALAPLARECLKYSRPHTKYVRTYVMLFPLHLSNYAMLFDIESWRTLVNMIIWQSPTLHYNHIAVL